MTVPERVWDELLEGDDGVDALRSFHDAGGIDIVTVDASSLFVEFRRDLDVRMVHSKMAKLVEGPLPVGLWIVAVSHEREKSRPDGAVRQLVRVSRCDLEERRTGDDDPGVIA